MDEPISDEKLFNERRENSKTVWVDPLQFIEAGYNKAVHDMLRGAAIGLLVGFVIIHITRAIRGESD